jgi:transcriptional regulator with XRE-family HTH domain
LRDGTGHGTTESRKEAAILRVRRSGAAEMLRGSGAALAAIRVSIGLSQPELAELTGLHVNTVSNIERGIGDASSLALSLIQVHLRCGGVTIAPEGFLPIPPRDESPAYPFPNLLTYPAAMVGIMGERVRERRLSLGLSQAELAAATGLHVNTVWGFERGIVIPSSSSLWLLYRGLGIRAVVGSAEGLLFN